MKRYIVTVNGEHIGTVEADSYTTAGHPAAKLVNKRGSRNLVGVRVTGDSEKSGMFQSYDRWKGGTLNSTGPQFHLLEE